MAINSARLVVDPVTENTRAKFREVVLTSTSYRPPDFRLYVDPVNGLSVESQNPQRKGEMKIFQDPTTGRSILMIVVDINSVLLWKEVRMTWYFSDALTGEEFRAL